MNRIALQRDLARSGGLLLLLVGAMAVFTVLSPDFLTSSNLLNMARLDTENGIIALGMAIVIASGGIDLSVGAILGLASVVLGYSSMHGVPIGMAIALALGVALLVTLGTLALYRGLAQGILNGGAFSNFSPSFEVPGQSYIGTVPGQTIVWGVVIAAIFVLTRMTASGRKLVAVGINELAARFSGIRIGAVRMAVYGASGLLAGIASVIYTSRVFSARGDAGGGLELLAIAAVVVGGATIRGGEISVIRTTLAVILIGVIPNGFVLAGIDTSWQFVAVGLVMVAAVAFNEVFFRPSLIRT
jgi:rhamnose transport system permease protein